MKLVRFLLPILLVGLAISCRAESNAVALDPAQEQFYSQFRSAIDGENARQLIGLTHPQALQCIKDEEKEYYYGLILQGLIQMLGRQQTIREIMSKKVDLRDIQQTSDTAGQSGMKWPIPPEEQLIIKFDKDGAENSATIFIARDQSQWKWVHLCFQSMPGTE